MRDSGSLFICSHPNATISWQWVGDTFTITEEWERDGLPNGKRTFEATRAEVNAVLSEVDDEEGICAVDPLPVDHCQSTDVSAEGRVGSIPTA